MPRWQVPKYAAPALLRRLNKVRPPRSPACPKYLNLTKNSFYRTQRRIEESSAFLEVSSLTFAVIVSVGGVSLALAESPQDNKHIFFPTASFGESEDDSKSRKDIGIAERRECKYLICGGGVAAVSAAQVLKANNPTANILVVAPEGLETSPSNYNEVNGERTKFPKGVAVLQDTVSGIDSQQREARTSNGTSIVFDECLIAVGTRIAPIPEEFVVAKYARHFLVDSTDSRSWRRIEELLQRNAISTNDDPHITILGSGWCACRVADTLLRKGADISFIFDGPALLARYLPRYLSDDIQTRLRNCNPHVDFISYSAVRYITARKQRSTVANDHVKNGEEAEVTVSQIPDVYSMDQFRTDLVIHAATDSPMSPLQDLSGSLEVDDGLLVSNAELAVASNVYGAGSCVRYPTKEKDRRSSWSETHARWSGQHAALNMWGGRAAYRRPLIMTVALPSIGLQLHTIGEVSSSLLSIGYLSRVSRRERAERLCGGSFGNGILFYLEVITSRGNPTKFYRVCGALLFDGDSRQPFSTDTVSDSIIELLEEEPRSRRELDTRLKTVASQILENGIESEQLQVRSTQPRRIPLSSHEILWISDVYPGSFQAARKESLSREVFDHVKGEFPDIPKSRDGLNPV